MEFSGLKMKDDEKVVEIDQIQAKINELTHENEALKKEIFYMSEEIKELESELQYFHQTRVKNKKKRNFSEDT